MYLVCEFFFNHFPSVPDLIHALILDELALCHPLNLDLRPLTAVGKVAPGQFGFAIGRLREVNDLARGYSACRQAKLEELSEVGLRRRELGTLVADGQKWDWLQLSSRVV
jgi:hypothetical protein